MADETVEDAVDGSAEAETAAESTPAEGASEEASSDEEESADQPVAAGDVYKIALALYLEGDAEAALKMIEEAKGRDDIDDKIKGKLEVLERRANKQATRRFARPGRALLGEDAPVAEGEAKGSLIEPKSEAASDEAASEEAATDETASDEAASDETATDEAASDETATDEAASDEAASDETATDEAASDEAAADESATDEAASDESAEEAASDEAATDEAATDEAASDEAASDETATDEAEAATDEAEAADEAATDEAATDEATTDEAASEEVGTAPPMESESSEIRSPLAEKKAEPKTEAPSTEAPSTEAPSTESGRVTSESGRTAVDDPRRPRGPRPGQAPRRPNQRPGGAPPRGAPPRGRGTPAQARPRPAAANALARDLEKIQDNMDRMAKSLRGVESHTMKVAEAYQRVARSGKRKEQAYDQLYEELRQYKDNFLLQAQKPLFKDLILLFDGVRRTARSYQESDEPLTKEAVVKSLEHLSDEILEMLYRRDIEQIEDYPEVLDIDFQKPVQRIETDDPSEDRKIEQVVREGFRMNGLVLRPQEVVVKRCTKEREA